MPAGCTLPLTYTRVLYLWVLFTPAKLKDTGNIKDIFLLKYVLWSEIIISSRTGIFSPQNYINIHDSTESCDEVVQERTLKLGWGMAVSAAFLGTALNER